MQLISKLKMTADEGVMGRSGDPVLEGIKEGKRESDQA